MGTIIVDLVTLTLKFDLLLKNFNLEHSFLTRRGKTSIFHMYIAVTRTFPMVPKFLTLKFDLLLKTLTLTISSLPEEVGLSYFTCAFLVARLLMPYHDFYAPGSNDRGHIVFVLSLFVCLFVCLSVVNFNLRYNFWTVRDSLHIWHAYSTNDSLSNDTKVNDLVTLTLTLKLKIAFWTLLPPGAYCSVSQTHLGIFTYWPWHCRLTYF